MRPGVFDPVAERSSLPLTHGWSFVPDPDASVHALGPAARRTPSTCPAPGRTTLGGVGGLVTGWYARRLAIPPEWAGDAALLRFGAVMSSCVVYLDGSRVGGHEGGYLPFEVDLTAHVRAGAAHDLAIRVRNPFGVFDRQPVYSEPAAIDMRLGGARRGADRDARRQADLVLVHEWARPTRGLSAVPACTSGKLAVRPISRAAGRRSAGRWTGRQTGAHAAAATGSRSRSSTLTVGGSRAGPGTASPRATAERSTSRSPIRWRGAGDPGALPRGGTPGHACAYQVPRVPWRVNTSVSASV